jgi:methionyl-tRNA formyltransferase
MKKVLILSDNEIIIQRCKELLETKRRETLSAYQFQFAYSSTNASLLEKYKSENWIVPMSIKENVDILIHEFSVILSLHCKQLFPKELVQKIRCINVHPGFNPYNRGWYPQVFSILHAMPCGATIHEMDEQLDHGPVIIQKEIKLTHSDTSHSAYEKIVDIEIELLDEYLEKILKGEYTPYAVEEGNINLKKDFEEICQLDLDDQNTFRNHINILRALSHGDFKNAYFLDEDGKKIYIKIELTEE